MNVQPAPEFLLFQDQNTYLTGSLYRKDVYHQNGLTVTHKVTKVKKQFSVMDVNYNGKVQHLQPIEPLKTAYYYDPFWVSHIEARRYMMNLNVSILQVILEPFDL
jgi:hypothetical protein